MAVIRVAVVIFAALAAPAAAETYGAVAGVNVIDFSDAGIDNTRLKIRPTIGGFYRIHRPVTLIDLGLQYSWRRVDWTVCGFSDCEGVPGADDGDWTFHDLEVPIVARVLVASVSTFRVNLFAGASPSLTLRKTETIEDGPSEPLRYITSVDVAFLAGAGVELRYGDLWLGLDVRGAFGVRNRYDPGDGDTRGHAFGGYLLLTASRAAQR